MRSLSDFDGRFPCVECPLTIVGSAVALVCIATSWAVRGLSARLLHEFPFPCRGPARGSSQAGPLTTATMPRLGVQFTQTWAADGFRQDPYHAGSPGDALSPQGDTRGLGVATPSGTSRRRKRNPCRTPACDEPGRRRGSIQRSNGKRRRGRHPPDSKAGAIPSRRDLAVVDSAMT